MELLYVYPWVALTAFLTFIIHELAHKISAEYYGLEAHYKANVIMLLISLAASLTGYLFFLGGAVVIEGGPYDKKENGIIAMAGPLSNITIAAIIVSIKFFTYLLPIEPFLDALFLMNALIAIYNMLPFYIFDGKKVFHWNKAVWVCLIATAIALMVLNYRFFYNSLLFL